MSGVPAVRRAMVRCTCIGQAQLPAIQSTQHGGARRRPPEGRLRLRLLARAWRYRGDGPPEVRRAGAGRTGITAVHARRGHERGEDMRRTASGIGIGIGIVFPGRGGSRRRDAPIPPGRCGWRRRRTSGLSCAPAGPHCGTWRAVDRRWNPMGISLTRQAGRSLPV